MADLTIALLRGINVGGTGKLPMADLRAMLEGLGAANVRTYIQSGNAVFEGAVSGTAISDAIEAAKGFRPRCLTMRAADLAAAVHANPFEFEAGRDMHFYFCAEAPDLDPATLAHEANGVERWHLAGKVFYLHSPGGLSQSGLAHKLERRLGVPATARNWNTVTKLLEMAG